jgi:hypothetical protein
MKAHFLWFCDQIHIQSGKRYCTTACHSVVSFGLAVILIDFDHDFRFERIGDIAFVMGRVMQRL